MQFFSNTKAFFLLFLLIIVLSGCGYKSSAKFSRAVMGERISTNVIISSMDPQNTVIIKDAVDRAIIEVFQASLVSRAESQTHLELKMGDPSYSPVVYDENGYVIAYRMSVSLNITKHTNGASKSYNTRGFHDFSVAPNAIVTDQDRFEAIGFAAQRAISSFVAQVSAEGARAKKKE
ncbi:LPS assembly lipoprotein LptE [Sulfurimonas sp.]|uniref:LPS assembly lipoprotein LptE n=1 Tax=Sulfurimonas sp. TaxID=2022749 RepID=UPI0025E840BF|nr:LPS assembly lipoprotein LptE [Sulfurimonas sp.]MCK9474161.1 LPS assembly lipoprotein LptE [Sulfurimonas sp.]MDD3505202.1 LPS assembly lipoprotein LptE [Sulfurimonas sp.]